MRALDRATVPPSRSKQILRAAIHLLSYHFILKRRRTPGRRSHSAARPLGRRFHILNAGSETEIDATCRALVERRVGALVVGSDPFVLNRRQQLIALAARHATVAELNAALAKPAFGRQMMSRGSRSS